MGGVSFSYRGSPALDGASLEVGAGEMLAVLGPNGSGKTTLLRCLCGILEPSGGAVSVNGADLLGMGRAEAATRMGYVPQHGDAPGSTVFDAVLLGRKPHMGWTEGEADRRIAERALEVAGLSEMALRRADELSGGERQLVHVARALAQRPEVLLMDEPTGSLDMANQHRVMRLVRGVIARNGMAAVVTMHDLSLAVRHADRFVMMRSGRVLAAGGAEAVTPESIKETYGIDAYVETVRGIPTVIPK
ncbi:MAG: ABC transporter ATP-binding protein [Candidatus Methanoplasma sp.]|nr:ABC transporter ATP-binding protein [Candidatus Methanoplasma sp.]